VKSLRVDGIRTTEQLKTVGKMFPNIQFLKLIRVINTDKTCCSLRDIFVIFKKIKKYTFKHCTFELDRETDFHGTDLCIFKNCDITNAKNKTGTYSVNNVKKLVFCRDYTDDGNKLKISFGENIEELDFSDARISCDIFRKIPKCKTTVKLHHDMDFDYISDIDLSNVWFIISDENEEESEFNYNNDVVRAMENVIIRIGLVDKTIDQFKIMTNVRKVKVFYLLVSLQKLSNIPNIGELFLDRHDNFEIEDIRKFKKLKILHIIGEKHKLSKDIINYLMESNIEYR
jgi:hypothetical protein